MFFSVAITGFFHVFLYAIRSPRKRKIENFEYQLRHFKSGDLKESYLEEIVITVDELEAMRFSFLENVPQIEAADCMDVHQSTFQRILKRALEKVTEALVMENQ